MQTRPLLDADIIDRHMRRAHALRSRAVLHALARIPGAIRRSAHAVTAVFA